MHRKHHVKGLVLILLGALLLLKNMGFLTVNVWAVFWPLLLITLGASRLIEVSSRPASYEKQETVHVPLQDASKGRVRLRQQAGQLYLDDGAAVDTLLAGTFDGGVTYEVQPTGSTISLDIKQPMYAPARHHSNRRQWEWHVSLNPDVVLTLDVATSGVDNKLDLSRLLVPELDVRVAGGVTRIRLPEAAGETLLHIYAEAGTAMIEVPPDVAAVIHVEDEATAIDVDQRRFPQEGNAYRSPGYALASNKVEMNVSSGSGVIRIR